MPITDKEALRVIAVRVRRDEISAEISKLLAESDRLGNELVAITGRCTHAWTEPKRHEKRHSGYHIPASGGGSDHRPATDVSPRIDVWYTRTCKMCGKTEKTMDTKPGKPVPAF